MTNSFEKFMQDEMHNEAEEIEQAVLKNKKLEYTNVPPEMYDNVMKKIEEQRRKEQYNRYLYLSEEELRWMRMGQEAEQNKKTESRTGKRKHLLKYRSMVAAASVVMLLVGAGMTSVGGPKNLMTIIEQVVNGRTMVQIDNVKEGQDVLPSEISAEEQAYQDINDKYGIEAVRMYYLPPGTEFQECIVEENADTIMMLYLNGEKSIAYRIRVNYVDNVNALDAEDKIITEEVLDLEDTSVMIKQYETKEGQILSSAHFSYKQVGYFLSGAISDEELEEIVKNLKFF